MKPEPSMTDGKVTAALVAEAAAWVAILHGPSRTAAAEKGFSQWLSTSPAHAKAFEEATEIWEESRNLPRPLRIAHRTPRFGVLRPVAALAAGAVLAVAGVFAYLHLSGVATEVGEQRALTLEDGSRVMLNTATHVVVSYDEHRRVVELRSGEALFEVAKRPDRPFIVIAGDRLVKALGTTFAVRRDDRRLAVTLVEGKVAITSSGSAGGAATNSEAERAITLSAGERAVFESGRSPIVDQPELQKVLAWQRREVALDDTPLPEAVAEMNRYSVTPLVIEQREAARVHVTGLFRAGDSLSFARAVAEAYELRVVEEPDRIVLSGMPR